jgi:hypothetical protein
MQAYGSGELWKSEAGTDRCSQRLQILTTLLQTHGIVLCAMAKLIQNDKSPFHSKKGWELGLSLFLSLRICSA